MIRAVAPLLECLPSTRVTLCVIPSPSSLCMVEHICNPGTQEVDPGGSEVQSHSQLYIEFEVSLDYMRPHQ